MRLTIIQDAIVWADKKANLDRMSSRLKDLAGKTDLVVLPEMFATGFCTDRLDLAEGMDGDTVSCLKRWAQEYNMAIAGSFIAAENGKIYNRAFFVFPDTTMRTADKRHLFSMGGEDKLFSAGDKRLIVNYKGFSISLLVCYDLRFPVWSRNVGNEYDLLIYVASWPQSRIKVWNVLLAARALENQAYVCGVNRIGEDGEGVVYNGSSRLIDAKGNDLLHIPLNETVVQTCELSKKELDVFRERFPVWRDADSFEIK
ncbi:amidohydrolase [Paludibacter sp. 221]|uniref:amidohydrolase n=1 Tax=Paludibacter sp. 221 TaxID=2302939 RepID=UPI0013D2AA99|nr:amidohydrolase [Paludibacter sp. 221]NDV45677.1 amidohydrolase [Paludibacter sp. 221]